MRSHAPLIRALLRATPDGLTTRQVCAALELPDGNTRKLLRAMPDAYIDRWTRSGGERWSAVWCVVVPPADCPRPD